MGRDTREKEPGRWRALERAEAKARKTQSTTKPRGESPTPGGQTQKRPSSATHHRETPATKLQGLPKGSCKGFKALEEERLAKSP